MAGSNAVGRERVAPHLRHPSPMVQRPRSRRRTPPRPGKHEHRSSVRALSHPRPALAHLIAHLSRSRTLILGLVGTIAVALVATTVGYFSLSRDVTLAVDGRTHTVRTFSGDVRGVLASEGIRLHSRDVVVPGLDSPVSDGTQISVRYSRPLDVSIDGTERTYWTTATNVATALD